MVSIYPYIFLFFHIPWMPYAYIIVAYYAEALCLYYRVLCMCYRCLLSVYHSQNQGNKNSSGLILYSLLQHVDEKTFYKILQNNSNLQLHPPPHKHTHTCGSWKPLRWKSLVRSCTMAGRSSRRCRQQAGLTRTATQFLQYGDSLWMNRFSQK